MIILLNKADVSTDDDRCTLLQNILEIGLPNLVGVYSTASGDSSRVLKVTKCPVCFSDDLDFRPKLKIATCQGCQAVIPLEATGLRDCVIQTVNVLPSLAREAFVSSQRISSKLKEARAKIIIKEYWEESRTTSNASALTRIFARVLVRLATLWNFADEGIKVGTEMAVDALSKKTLGTSQMGRLFTFISVSKEQRIHTTALSIIWNRFLRKVFHAIFKDCLLSLDSSPGSSANQAAMSHCIDELTEETIAQVEKSIMEFDPDKVLEEEMPTNAPSSLGLPSSVSPAVSSSRKSSPSDSPTIFPSSTPVLISPISLHSGNSVPGSLSSNEGSTSLRLSTDIGQSKTLLVRSRGSGVDVAVPMRSSADFPLPKFPKSSELAARAASLTSQKAVLSPLKRYLEQEAALEKHETLKIEADALAIGSEEALAAVPRLYAAVAALNRTSPERMGDSQNMDATLPLPSDTIQFSENPVSQSPSIQLHESQQKQILEQQSSFQQIQQQTLQQHQEYLAQQQQALSLRNDLTPEQVAQIISIQTLQLQEAFQQLVTSQELELQNFLHSILTPEQVAQACTKQTAPEEPNLQFQPQTNPTLITTQPFFENDIIIHPQSSALQNVLEVATQQSLTNSTEK
eukprot:TRINITY_DN948_c2_g1_i1.p1 TRINITY_DN948_c2_g1~~TRINITY_DN948_c2_g1_i1.p1  ORF type:complete len:630 (-),score=177.75 TRINITY_DN948_c2_g1_i1:477-2366(-)